MRKSISLQVLFICLCICVNVCAIFPLLLLNPSIWTPSLFHLPRGHIPWTVATKTSKVNGGKGCHLPSHLLKPLERFFYLRLNFIFGWKWWQHGPLALIGKILYIHIRHFFFLATSGITFFPPPLGFFLLEMVIPNVTYLLTSRLFSHFRFGLRVFFLSLRF